VESKPNQMNFRDVTAALEVSHNEKRKFLIEALDDALAECVAKAARYQSKASLTVKIGVAVTGDKVSIAAVLDTTIPRPTPTTIPAYVDAAGRLLSEDPRQENLFTMVPGEGQQP
jgi:hypothetical protein